VIVGVLLWVPIKVVAFCLRPFIPTDAALENLANLTNQAIDEYLEEHPL
jgi:hypothetical protein